MWTVDKKKRLQDNYYRSFFTLIVIPILTVMLISMVIIRALLEDSSTRAILRAQDNLVSVVGVKEISLRLLTILLHVHIRIRFLSFPFLSRQADCCPQPGTILLFCGCCGQYLIHCPDISYSGFQSILRVPFRDPVYILPRQAACCPRPGTHSPAAV